MHRLKELENYEFRISKNVVQRIEILRWSWKTSLEVGINSKEKKKYFAEAKETIQRFHKLERFAEWIRQL